MSIDEETSCSDDVFDGQDHEDEEICKSHEEYRQRYILYQKLDRINGRSRHAKQKSRRRRWTQRDMTNAYNAVKYQGMSLRGAATAFNVPESTLRDRIHGRVSLECSRPGPPTFFTFEEEKKMVDHILFMSKIGYPYTRNQVVELAGDMTKAVGRIAPFKYLNPSQAWFYAFLNRWPALKNFLFGPRSPRKSKCISGNAIQSYFQQLDKALTNYGIKDKPGSIWIFDEVSISCENQPPRILPIGIQRAQSVSYWNPTVAVIGCANASGEKIPPFLVYLGDSISTSMMEGAVRGTRFYNSASGWVNSDTFIQWLTKHFRTTITVRPIILLYDGHLQFISVRVLERAREEGVFLFPLPPHSAYNHCVENTCFITFQHFFERRLWRFFEKNPDQPLVKVNVAPVLTHAYERALQPTNMISLFEKLGIYPLNYISPPFGAFQNMLDENDCTNTDSDEFPLGYTGEIKSHWQDPTICTPVISSISKCRSLRQKPSILSKTTSSNSIISKQEQSASKKLICSSLFLNAEESRTVTIKRTATPLWKNHSPRSFISAKNCRSANGPLTTRFPRSSDTGSNVRCFSIRLDRPVLNRNNPLIENSCTDTTSPMLSSIHSVKKSSLTHISQFRVIPAGNSDTPLHSIKNDSLDFQETISTELIAGELASRPSVMNRLISESTLSKSVGPNFDHHLLRKSDPRNNFELIDNIEEGEAPGLCTVCGELEPPEFLSDSQYSENYEDCQVVDWAHCDYCNSWVHLNRICSGDAIIGDNVFVCSLCRGIHEEKTNLIVGKVNFHESLPSHRSTAL